MTREARAELISAYLDGELDSEEAARFEQLMEEDADVRQELEGMRSVVSNLRHLQQMAPPATLGQDVARRIALDGERRSLLDRVESGLEGAQLQSNTFLMFALIVALALIILFFAIGLQRWSSDGLTPVVISQRAPADASPEDMEPEVLEASTVFVAGRLFHRAEDGRWVQDGLAEQHLANARLVDLESEIGKALLAERPDLRGVAMLGHALVLHEGEILELCTLPHDAAGAPQPASPEAPPKASPDSPSGDPESPQSP